MGTHLTKYLWRIGIIGLITLQSCVNKPTNTEQLVTISTRLGDIKLILFDDTPLHKKSFLELAEEGAYDSTTFHRVIQGFMIQGGDFSKNPKFEVEARRLIPAEILPNHFHKRGALAAARQSINRNPLRKSSTQFYIVQGTKFSREALTTNLEALNSALPRYLYNGEHQELIDKIKVLQDSGKTEEIQELVIALRPDIEATLKKDFTNTEITEEQIEVYTTIGGAPHLDGGYTVFGEVLAGMETVDKIAALEVDTLANPLEAVFMKLTIEELPKDSITARYGFIYPEPENENQ